jgi:phosphomethylpyrimidine synthase
MTASQAHPPAGNRPKPGWHKGYITGAEGSRPDLRVPVRRVHLTAGRAVLPARDRKSVV